MSSYRTIEGRASAEIVEKKSRFIAQLCHVQTEDEALAFLQEIRTLHAQSRHNVYAYVLRGGRVRYSDDGEPAQTAGIPTYEVIKHADLVDIACVTTRYFGGTLLGTGGLVRAYTESCRLALDAASIVTVSECADMSLVIPYELYQPLLRMANEANAKIASTDFAEKVTITLRVLVEDANAVEAKLVELTRGQCRISKSEPFEGVM